MASLNANVDVLGIRRARGGGGAGVLAQKLWCRVVDPRVAHDARVDPLSRSHIGMKSERGRLVLGSVAYSSFESTHTMQGLSVCVIG